jgi:hypothetical protein
MQQQERHALELAADTASVGPEFVDDLSVELRARGRHEGSSYRRKGKERDPV